MIAILAETCCDVKTLQTLKLLKLLSVFIYDCKIIDRIAIYVLTYLPTDGHGVEENIWTKEE
jgi:hypothetical protein